MGRERYQCALPAQDFPLLAQSEPLGPEELSLPRGTLASPFLCLQHPRRLQMAVCLGTAAATVCRPTLSCSG